MSKEERRRKKQKEREERLRKMGSQTNFKPITHKDKKTGLWQIYLILGVMIAASAFIFYNMR